MPGPSDIRVNPFNNATNYVNLTERHIVPSVSPFVVRLNEVPEKQDPSNMQMYYVDDTTGQTTETALTEVAATPGAGEFRPDYSTNAFDDTSWNTGLIEFSSADAGKIIEVSYTATGTLAGVKTNRYPAWWLDRGDGSDGDFVPESNVTISGEKNYKSVFIKSGVTVTVSPHARLKIQGCFTNNGIITANGVANNGAAASPGATGGYGYGAGNGSSGNNGSQTNGAAGGSAKYGEIAMTITSEIADLLFYSGVYCHGAGGGAAGANSNHVISPGGNGGGCIQIVCSEYNNTGTISANGVTGYASGGSTGGTGGGGCVAIIANRVNEQGTVTATGGGNGWTRMVEIGG